MNETCPYCDGPLREHKPETTFEAVSYYCPACKYTRNRLGAIAATSNQGALTIAIVEWPKDDGVSTA